MNTPELQNLRNEHEESENNSGCHIKQSSLAKILTHEMIKYDFPGKQYVVAQQNVMPCLNYMSHKYEHLHLIF